MTASDQKWHLDRLVKQLKEDAKAAKTAAKRRS